MAGQVHSLMAEIGDKKSECVGCRQLLNWKAFTFRESTLWPRFPHQA